jgi:hypothetical protein
MSISFHVVPQVDRIAWNERLAGTGALCFHSADWQDFACAGETNRTPIFLEWRDGESNIVAVGTGAELASRRFPMSVIGRSLLMDALPVLVDGPAVSRSSIVQAMLHGARANGYVRVHFSGFGAAAEDGLLNRAGFSTTPRFEFLIDLESGEDVRWKAMEAQRRNKVRRARRDGVMVEDITTREAAVAFTQLQKETADRIRARGAAMADPPPEDITLGRFEHLVQSGLGVLRVARWEGQAVAVGVFSDFNRSSYFIQSAASEQGLRVQAPSLLLWDTMCAFEARGGRTLNLGGVSGLAENPTSPEHGLYVFKRGFGPERISSASGDRILRPGINRVHRALQRGAAFLQRT